MQTEQLTLRRTINAEAMESHHQVRSPATRSALHTIPALPYPSIRSAAV